MDENAMDCLFEPEGIFTGYFLSLNPPPACFLWCIFIACVRINIPDTCTSAHIKMNMTSFISMIRHSNKSAWVSVFIFIGRDLYIRGICISDTFTTFISFAI